MKSQFLLFKLSENRNPHEIMPFLLHNLLEFSQLLLCELLEDFNLMKSLILTSRNLQAKSHITFTQSFSVKIISASMLRSSLLQC
jgi:hypothetical protein